MSRGEEDRNVRNQTAEDEKASELLKMFSADLTDAKAHSNFMVQNTKAKIARLLHNVIGKEPTSIDEEDIDNQPGRSTVTEARVSTVFGESIAEGYDKIALDIQVAALFDEYLVREAQSNFGHTCINEKLQKLVTQVTMDLQHENNFVENEIKTAKNNFEEYLADVVTHRTEMDNDNARNLLENVFNSLRAKAYLDLCKQSENSKKLVEKTKRNLIDNFGVFLTNPTRKSSYEIEAENYVKQHLLQFKEKVEKDLLASKEVTEKIADDTKDFIEKSLEDIEPVVPEYDFRFSNAANDLKLINESFEEDINYVKQKNIFKEPAQGQLLRVDQALKEGISRIKTDIDSKIQKQTVLKGTTKVEAMLAEKAEKDFKEADQKTKEAVEALKVKVSESTKSLKSQVFPDCKQ